MASLSSVKATKRLNKTLSVNKKWKAKRSRDVGQWKGLGFNPLDQKARGVRKDRATE